MSVFDMFDAYYLKSEQQGFVYLTTSHFGDHCSSGNMVACLLCNQRALCYNEPTALMCMCFI